MSTFRGNRQRPPRLSLPVVVSLCKLLGVKQVQGIMFQVSRSVSLPIEKRKFIYSSFHDAVNSWKFIVSVWRWLLNNEMEMTKRSGRGLFDVPCCHLTGGTEKDVCWARIRTENFPERYCLSLSVKLECYTTFYSIFFLSHRRIQHYMTFAVRWANTHGTWVAQILEIMPGDFKHMCHTS